jgi:hypothetical protein
MSEFEYKVFLANEISKYNCDVDILY